jgi:glycosyltransferase involved in cell wall biosynthesis
VKLLGNRNDVPELLRSAHVFLMSSKREGFPISLLEATASGLPFIAPDVGGCREMAELYGNGVIVPPGDAQALADAITQLAENPSRGTELSRAAGASAPTISITNAASQHVHLYKRLLAKTEKGTILGMGAIL